MLPIACFLLGQMQAYEVILPMALKAKGPCPPRHLCPHSKGQLLQARGDE